MPEPVLSIEGQKILEKERKRKKKMKQIYDITEDAKEDNSEAEEEDALSSQAPVSETVAIPQPSIL